jgi:hypothetical protein
VAYALDDEWDNGPMIRKAGTAAFGLYSRCGLWVSRQGEHGTDGFIPADLAADYGTREWAAKLVDAGLWEVVEGGFQDLHYLKRNPSAAKVGERKAADAKRKAEWRVRKESQGQSKRSHSGTSNGTPRSPAPLKGGGLVEPHPYPTGAHECDRCTLPPQHAVHRLLTTPQ